jgi:NOL1/NOP2/fmu family ribosome biogenesis protein
VARRAVRLKVFPDRRYESATDDPGGWLGEQFGLPQKWDESLTWRGKDADRWLMTPEVAGFREAPVVRRGLRSARTVRNGAFKPTTDWTQLFGRDFTQHVVGLNQPSTTQYLKGLDLPLRTDLGYVALEHSGIVYGVGLGQPDKLKNQLPVSRRIP